MVGNEGVLAVAFWHILRWSFLFGKLNDSRHSVSGSCLVVRSVTILQDQLSTVLGVLLHSLVSEKAFKWCIYKLVLS